MLVELKKVIEAIKNYGKSAIDNGKKSLDCVDDIIAIVKAVEEISSLPSDEERFEKMCEQFCDGYCKFPYICKTEEKLESKCNSCPICKMTEEIQVHEGEARENFAVKLISWEYRDLTQYYKSRFARYACKDKFKIRFRAGYRADSPLMECTVSLFVGSGRIEWGAPANWRGFILKIHNLEVKQWN